jgi:flagellar export protein FliJ
MKNPLESVLTIKRWEEDEAKQLLGDARRALTLEEQCLMHLQEHFGLMQERGTAMERKGVAIDTLFQLQKHLEHLTAQVRHQKTVVAEKQRLLDEAMRILAETAKERKVFEKVDERQKKAERDAKLKQEQKGMDEHAVTRYKKH